MKAQKRKYCNNCGCNTLHESERFGDGWGCLLTIVTCGMFIPIWFLLYFCQVASGYVCQCCGSKN